jgi:DNA-directed RNA polymerase specialized sigma subunit
MRFQRGEWEMGVRGLGVAVRYYDPSYQVRMKTYALSF